MKELAGRLAALDPDAGAALQVIAYFDRLTEGRVGLEALVRGAAVLSGCTARLIDERRGVRVRVTPDGRRDDSAGPVDPAWPWVPLKPVASAAPDAASAASLALDTASLASAALGTASAAAPALGTASVASAPPATASVASAVPGTASVASAVPGTASVASALPGTASVASAPPATPSVAPPVPATASVAPPALATPASPPPDTAPAAVPETPAALWLERPGPPDGVQAMILERAARAVRDVMDRTRGWAPPAVPATHDPALVEVVLDASAPQAARRHAAAQLGLKQGELVRAVAFHEGGAEIVAAGRRVSETRRAGVGPAVEPAELPHSWAAARTALRLTAEGTAQDPGARTVYAEELGGLALLATAVGPGTPPIPDVLAVERALAEAPWAAATLHAVAAAPSLRAAAAELTVHHSTLQERLAQAEHILGWDVHAPQGRLRLQLALAVRKLRRTPADTGTGQAAPSA
ncbi:helix-turn-helix domain-containing protein [Streptomyces sp. NPDC001530]|uniref:helix-turn-helix domain-containing protein n=1 Tax=Streptomyces sp. NPDC001530 TaxID=3364582 RepID=UPI003678A6E3